MAYNMIINKEKIYRFILYLDFIKKYFNLKSSDEASGFIIYLDDNREMCAVNNIYTIFGYFKKFRFVIKN